VSTPLLVLVADDDLGARLVAKAAIEALGHSCVTAADGDDAWRLFVELEPDVLVTDRMMPGLDGVELCRRIRGHPIDRYTYIVLLTALSDPDDVLSGMRAGADDYLTKPLSPVDLEARLLSAARVTSLHAELAMVRKELAKMARTDPLTGLPNRLALIDDLAVLDRDSERYGRVYSIALCDIDYFKRYNDTYGHLEGDSALRAVATAIAGALRAADRVYRYGGEEFLVVLGGQGASEAAIALERVRSAVERTGIEHRRGAAGGVVTISCGLSMWVPARRLTSEQLIAEADQALYEAKAAGRNRITAARSQPPPDPSAS